MADFSGRKFGKYELIDRLGRGGMADVYKAYQPGMDRLVAVKLLHGHLAESDDFIERFKREAQSVGQLRHPHIVQVIDFDVEGDVYYMVMEYIRGDTLKAYISQRGALPAIEAVRISEKLSDALAYAHENGMIHRDIKPANVMFTDETFTHPVLTDFGIARILGASGITVSGAFIGTPAYMSPESAQGAKVDERADIYSMGIMLYEMLTGAVPYDADTPFAVVMKHVNEPLPSLRQFNRDLPEHVELVLLKALSKDPAARYQTASDLRDALRKSRESLANLVETRPSDSTLPDFRAGMSGAATLAGDHSGDIAPTVAEAVPTPPPLPAERRRIPWLAVGGIAIVILAIIGVLLLVGGGDEDESGGTRDESAGQVATETSLPATDEPAPSEISPTATDAPPPSETPDFSGATGTRFTPDDDPAIIARLNEITTMWQAQGPGAALVLADDALEDYPDDPVLLDIRASLNLALGDPVLALADAEAARDLHPDHPASYLALSNYYFNAPDYDYERAFEFAGTALELAPDQWGILLHYARALSNIGQDEEAIQYFNSAEEAGAPEPIIVIGRAESYWELGRYADALVDYQRILEFEDRPEARFAVMGAHILLDQPEEALSLATEGIQHYEDNPDFYSAAAYIAYRAGEDALAEEWAAVALAFDGDQLDGYYVQALVAARRGEYTSAIATLRRLIDQPDWKYSWPYLNITYGHSLHLDLAQINRAQGNIGRTAAYFTQAIENAAGWYLPYWERARWFIERGEPLTALPDYGRAVLITRDFDSALSDTIAQEVVDQSLEITQLAVFMLIRNWEVETAIYVAEMGLETYPDEPILFALQAQAYLLLDDPATAQETAQAAIDAAADSPFGYMALAEVHYYTREADEEMRAAAERAYELGPDVSRVLLTYARVLRAMEEYEVALEIFQQIEINSYGIDPADLLFERGYYALNLDRPDIAIADFTQLLNMDPSPEAVLGLTQAYLFNGEPDMAYQVAVDQAELPFDEPAYQAGYLADLAFVAYAAGQNGTAQEWVERALETTPDLPQGIYLNALLLARAGEYPAALERLLSLEELESWQYDDPFLNDHFGHVLNVDIARVYRAMGDSDQALAYYQHVPYRLVFYVERAEFYIELGETEAARSDLMEARNMTDDPVLQDEIRQRIIELGPAPASE